MEPSRLQSSAAAVVALETLNLGAPSVRRAEIGFAVCREWAAPFQVLWPPRRTAARRSH